jgi:hypothetical protein
MLLSLRVLQACMWHGAAPQERTQEGTEVHRLCRGRVAPDMPTCPLLEGQGFVCKLQSRIQVIKDVYTWAPAAAGDMAGVLLQHYSMCVGNTCDLRPCKRFARAAMVVGGTTLPLGNTCLDAHQHAANWHTSTMGIHQVSARALQF